MIWRIYVCKKCTPYVQCTCIMCTTSWSHTKRTGIDLCDVRHISNLKYEGSHLTHHTSVSNLFGVNAAATHETKYIVQLIHKPKSHSPNVYTLVSLSDSITFICTHRRSTPSIQAHKHTQVLFFSVLKKCSFVQCCVFFLLSLKFRLRLSRSVVNFYRKQTHRLHIHCVYTFKGCSTFISF